MRKTLIPFLIAGVLSFASCTETFEPTVDYGDQTYINDYSALVAAVNNLNKSLDERFAALNKLLDKNMAELKVAIDGNTGAIKILGDNLESSLASINTTLFNGFTALTTQIDENGKKVVYAMNTNGELLRLQMDATGKLISAQIETSAAKLAETINGQNADMAERFDALTLAMQAGLADISVKIDNVDKTLKIQLGSVNTNLGTLNTTMLNGFTALNTTITDNGGQIIEALNSNGELLRLQIDATGKLISAQIVESNKTLIEAINSQTTSLEAKFDALNGLITSGFASVTTKLDEVGAELHTDIQGVNSNLTAGFTTLGTKVDENGTKIVEAINAEGDKLEIALDKNGNIITTAIEDFNKEYTSTEAANLAKLGEILGAVNTLNTSIGTMDANEATRNQAIVDKLNEILAKDKIYTVPGNDQEIYMAETKYQQIEEAGPNSNIYDLYADQLTVLQVHFKTAQVVDASGSTHDHATFTPMTAKDAAPVLVASSAAVFPGIADGNKVVKVVKTAVDRNYKVQILYTGCSHLTMFAMRLTDATGQKYSTFAATKEAHEFQLLVFDKSTGTIQNNIIGVVYCSPNTDPTATYPEVAPNKLNDQP